MKYYFQINNNFPEKRWEDCEPIVMEFLTRADACNAAKLLSAANDFTDIRWSAEPNYKHNSGAYTRATKEETQYRVPEFNEQI